MAISVQFCEECHHLKQTIKAYQAEIKRLKGELEDARRVEADLRDVCNPDGRLR